MKSRYLIGMLLIMSLGLVGPRAVVAEEEPSPGVARVSLIHGDVSTMRGDSGDWVASTVNAPIVRGDKVATGARSRAEIQLDYANILRLDQRSEAKIADLTRTHIQIQVASGLVDFTVLKGTEADVEIDTPNMAVRPLGEGVYRIQVNSASETQLTVRKGEAEVATPQGSTTVEKDRVIYVRGTDNPEYQLAKAAHKDEWDEWNSDRDHEIKDAGSWRYANHYYTGAHELDRYGRWTYVPDYDWCWTPYVNLGWVPYRDGRWVWEPYWGWTWVSYEPWGWAPYHYGRWFYYGSSWCWWPGYRHYGYYPAWAPAHVSFLGFGLGGHNWHFGFGFGFNSIGWLPLGPYDVISPWWGYHNSYNVVNITNITNLTNVRNATNVSNDITTHIFVRGRGAAYASNFQAALNNANVRRAVTTVSTNDFVNGRVPRNVRGVDAETLRQAGVVRGTVPAVPTRESLRPTDKPARVPAVAQAANNERFFTRRPTPAGPTSSFSERAAQIQEMMQRHNPLGSTGQGAAAGQANANAARPGAPTNPTMTAERMRNDVGRQPGQTGLANANRPGMGGTQQNPTNNAEAQISRPAATAPAARGAVAPESPATRSLSPQQAERGLPAGVRPSERPGWQRFGQAGTSGLPRTNVNPADQAEVGTNAGASQTREARPAQPTPAPQAQRPWQRFGTGSVQPGQAGRPAVGATPQEARPAPDAKPATAPRPATPPAAREGTSPGWQRSGQGAPSRPEGVPRSAPAPSTDRPSARERWPAAVNVPGSTAAPATESAAPRTVQPRPVPSSRGEDQGGWSRFDSQPRPAPTERGAGSSAPRPAPSAGGGERDGWRGFTPSSRPAPAERSPESSAPRSEPASPGWSRSPSHREGPGYGSAPRNYQRPPLEIRKPIVTERPSAPRSYGGGGNRGWSAPSGGGRNYAPPSGGNRGWSAPSSGGRSAPSPLRSFPRSEGRPKGGN